MPRRRLTLAPGALSPASCTLGSTGSRFCTLDSEDGSDAEKMAIEAAEEVLKDGWEVSRDDVCRPPKSDEDIAKEFWTDIGFPTPASRVWEKSPPSLSVNKGTSSAFVCRADSTSSTDEDASSSSSGSTGGRCGGGSSPQARALRRLPLRMGWRGPIPR